MSDPGGPSRPRARAWWRWALGVVVGAVVLAVLLSHEGELSGARSRLAHLNWGWYGVVAAAEAASILAFAGLQEFVLRVAGPSPRLSRLFAVSVASNAIALTVPGEPVVSSAYRYRRYRDASADGPGSAWAIVTVIVVQAVGMTSLLLVGVLVTLATHGRGSTIGAAVVALAVVGAALVFLVRRDALDTLARGALRLSRRLTRHPRGRAGARADAFVAELAERHLTGERLVVATLLAVLMWLADCACLAASFAAVRAPVPWSGLIIAYGVAQIAMVLPVSPGGLGLVEGGLTVVLVAYGATRVGALSAALAYRIVNYWLAAAIGWATVGALAWSRARSARAGAPSAPG